MTQYGPPTAGVTTPPVPCANCAEVASRITALTQAVERVAATLERGSGGRSDPFHVGMDAADELRVALAASEVAW